MTNSINVYFLNVQQGDSIVIEFCADDVNRYVVIDSNLIKKDNVFINPAYELLKSKEVEKISTLIITHFDKDHYNGIEQLLQNIDIDKIVIPPVLSNKSKVFDDKIIKKISDIAKDLIYRSADEEIVQHSESLAYLIYYLTNNETKIEEGTGKESILRFPDIPEITATTYLPFKKIKGILRQKVISDGNFNQDHFLNMNESSIAFKLACFGCTILFTGDSDYKQWRDHKNLMLKDNITNLGIQFLKAPHHGSKYNNNEELYSYFFKQDNNQKYIFISSNGIKHPDKEIFNLIEKFDLSPFCTNLSSLCRPENVSQFKQMNNIPENIRSVLYNYVEETPQPCQGDITLNISPKGINISNSTDRPCLYRNM
jgi:beta-lactamase superfamily II metal-dependent hydrolase